MLLHALEHRFQLLFQTFHGALRREQGQELVLGLVDLHVGSAPRLDEGVHAAEEVVNVRELDSKLPGEVPRQVLPKELLRLLHEVVRTCRLWLDLAVE